MNNWLSLAIPSIVASVVATLVSFLATELHERMKEKRKASKEREALRKTFESSIRRDLYFINPDSPGITPKELRNRLDNTEWQSLKTKVYEEDPALASVLNNYYIEMGKLTRTIADMAFGMDIDEKVSAFTEAGKKALSAMGVTELR